MNQQAKKRSQQTKNKIDPKDRFFQPFYSSQSQNDTLMLLM
jgi:hypothetical protein